MDDSMPDLSALTPENFELLLRQMPSEVDILRPVLCMLYATSKFTLFQRWGRIEDLEEAVQKARQGIEVIPEKRPDLARIIDYFGSELRSHAVSKFTLFQRLGRIEDLEEAIQKARQAVEVTPEDHPDLAAMLSNLGGMLESRYKRIGKIEDLEEAIQKAGQATKIIPEDHPNLATMLSSIGSMLESRYERTGKTEDLEEAIQKAGQAIKIIPEDHPDLAGMVNNLGGMHESRYKRTGKTEDLEEAIQKARQAIKIIPEDHPDLAKMLNNLGNKLESRYKRTGKTEDLEEAVQKARQAVKVTPEDHPDLAVTLSNLGGMLESRYERTGKIEDLEEAVQKARQTVKVTPEDHPDLAAILSNLGGMLESRYERTGKMEDLEEAVQKARQAVKVTPEDHTDLAITLSNLGGMLESRYKRTGKIEDLEEAIQKARQAVKVTPEDHPDLAKWLINLGGTLKSRYERTGKIEDLEETIQKARQAVEVTPKDHPDLATMLNNLGSILESRYKRTGKIEDLEEAVQKARRAVEVTPEDHPNLAGMLNNLGNKLESRYERTGKTEDLEAAIQKARQAVKVTSEDHPDLTRWLSNLGNKLESRYARTGKTEDLEEALQKARQAIKIIPEDHPDLAAMLNSLGNKLENRYKRTGKIEDLQAAVNLFQKAWKSENATPFVRIRASTQAIRLLQSQGEFETAYDISVEAISLLNLVHNRSLAHQDQQFVVSQFSGLATTACSLALQTGKGPEAALTILEQGRGAILSLLMDDRSDTSELKAVDPLLCEQYETLRLEVNKPVKDATDDDRRNTTFVKRPEAIAKLEKCIQKIQLLRGFSNFQKALNPKQMQSCASKGSIVIINIAEYRCDALLVEQHRIRSLILPDLHIKDIKKKAQNSSLGDPRILEWLWDVVANPVLDVLGLAEPPSDNIWPHIWWIPTGLLSRFPLHAAGYHGKGSSQTVLDRAMSSYSPSIKSIIHGRRPRLQDSTLPSGKVLLVAMPDTPRQSPLHFAAEEAEVLSRIFRSMSLDLIEPGTYKQDVMSHLRNCKIFHFAGHGHTDDLDPSQSHLLLRDWENDRFTVANILELNLYETLPVLAYLSACGTGRVKDEKIVDESIHLISACQLAGFRHVIGTLWEVDDESCKDMARITYEVIRDDGMTDDSICLGLHKATRELRNRWLNVSKETRDPSNSIQKALVEFWEINTRARDGNQEDVRKMQETKYRQTGSDKWDSSKAEADEIRDVNFCEESPLPWVPYVHFGV